MLCTACYLRNSLETGYCAVQGHQQEEAYQVLPAQWGGVTWADKGGGTILTGHPSASVYILACFFFSKTAVSSCGWKMATLLHYKLFNWWCSTASKHWICSSAHAWHSNLLLHSILSCHSFNGIRRWHAFSVFISLPCFPGMCSPAVYSRLVILLRWLAPLAVLEAS